MVGLKYSSFSQISWWDLILVNWMVTSAGWTLGKKAIWLDNRLVTQMVRSVGGTICY